MTWKSLLIIFLILAIGGLLFFTRQGKQYADFLITTVGRFLATYGINFPSLGFSGQSFPIQVSIDKESFRKVSFDALNSSIRAVGLCVSDIKIENLFIDKMSKNCDVVVKNGNGKIDFTVGGSLLISVNSPEIILNGENYYASNSNLDVKVEILPEALSLVGIKNNELSLNVLFGEAKKLREDGSIDVLKNLYNETVTISNFVGSLELSDYKYILRGFSTQIKGLNWVLK
ncbi:MAG: hypothetical protein QXQ18_02165 [Candidatus Aenigmatarchaeota archaeon]